MVSSADDLAALTEIVAPGSIAYTAGEQNKWQLGIDYTWHSFSADETSETASEESSEEPSANPSDDPSEEPSGDPSEEPSGE